MDSSTTGSASNRTIDAATSHAHRRSITRLYLARGLRDFGDGYIAVLLPVYLSMVGLGAAEIGLTSTIAMLGSALTTIGLGYAASRINTRWLLMAASCLMAATGLAISVSETYWAILLVAAVGFLNPSPGGTTSFVPMEHAALAHASLHKDRTRNFARYSLVGALCAALGALAAASPDALARLHIAPLTAIKGMFVLYAALGCAGAVLYYTLPLVGTPPRSNGKSALGTSRAIVIKMMALFSLDSFAGGFAVQSLLALWLFMRFDLSLYSAGLFFFWSGILTALSFPIAAWLASRIGLIHTMVFTHIPANLCLMGTALAPTLELALILLLIRAVLSDMDVPARSSFVMSVVTPQERTAAATFTTVPRSLAGALSPAIAGAFFASGLHALPFVIGAVLKIVYDLLLLWAFIYVKPPEEQT